MVKTKPGIKIITKRLVDNLEHMNVRVQRIILFGSYANGIPNSYSDIDMAVISSSFEGKNFIKRQEILGEAILLLQEPIEALGYTLKEFRNAVPMSFLSEVISTGKIIYKA